MISKPMLSGTAKSELLDEIEWPVLVSHKIDGIRCVVHPDRGAVTRKFIAVPNAFIREMLIGLVQDRCLDGELIALNEDGTEMTFNETQSAVMSHGGTPKFKYAVFDCFQVPDDPFVLRLALAAKRVGEVKRTITEQRRLKPHGVYNLFDIEVVEHTPCTDKDIFLHTAQCHIEDGHEGTMIRSKEGPYKNGRSTFRQGWLLKYKAWSDAEGTVVGFEELMHNDNEDVRDELGHAKRSHAKDGMVPMDTLGAFVLETEWGEVKCGSGLDDATRYTIWMSKELYLGKTVSFKYFAYGMKDKPRQPIFKGFRHD